MSSTRIASSHRVSALRADLLLVLEALRRRRRGAVIGTAGLVALVGLVVVAYPTVRDNTELDTTFGDLPPSVQQLLGITAGDPLTSPAGYLNSQLFANILPLLLMVFAISIGAWAVAGEESAGVWSCCSPTRSAALGWRLRAPRRCSSS